MRIISFLKTELLFNGHLQSTGVAGLVWLSAYLSGFSVDATVILAAYFLFQTIYWFDRWYGIDADALTNTIRSEHLRKHKNLGPFEIIFATFILVALLNDQGFLVNVFSATVLFLGVLYPIFFKQITRYIPLFKNLYVSTVFALMVPYVALFNDQSFLSFEAETYLLMLFVLLNALLIQILLDTKDVESDRDAGLKTFPVLFGLARTNSFVKRVNGLLTLIFVFAPSLGMLALANGVYIHWHAQGVKDRKYTSYLYLSAALLLWTLVVLAGSIV